MKQPDSGARGPSRGLRGYHAAARDPHGFLDAGNWLGRPAPLACDDVVAGRVRSTRRPTADLASRASCLEATGRTADRSRRPIGLEPKEPVYLSQSRKGREDLQLFAHQPGETTN